MPTLCPFRTDTWECRVSSTIAGCAAKANASACAVCGSLPSTGAPNQVTVSLAIGAVRDNRELAASLFERYGHLLRRVTPDNSERLEAILAGAGPGSHLWRLLESIGITHDPNCDCLGFAEKMNAWGGVGCRQHRAEIIERLRTQQKRYGWAATFAAAGHAIKSGLAFRLNPLDPFGSLADEAIRLAEEASAKAPFDIVLPLGPGSQFGNAELRYALRSIRKHAIGLRRVVVIGAIPGWLRETDRVQPVPLREFETNKASRIALKFRYAFERLDVTDTVAMWNDDYVMLRDQDIRTIPSIYRGGLWRRPTNGWKGLLRHTAEVLQAAGFTQRHFDIHVPILYEREKFLGINHWWDRSAADASGFVAKSIYGNIHCQDAIPGKDAKVQANWRQRVNAERVTRRWIFSHGDGALQTGLLDWLQARFPEPAPWEGPGRTRPMSRQRARHIRRRGRCCT